MLSLTQKNKLVPFNLVEDYTLGRIFYSILKPNVVIRGAKNERTYQYVRLSRKEVRAQ